MNNYSYKDENPIDACWNANPSAPSSQRGTYIAVAGNTGSGKSTLVAELTSRLKAEGRQVVGINERKLHHPLLPLMFHEPSKYALGIQLNFLLQRHLVLYRWLDLGYVVVIERSHLDDRLFVETHLDQGNISVEEAAAYNQLSETLARRLPDPDIYVFLDASPDLSLRRLEAAARSGERPEEFPDEQSRLIFVNQWQKRFKLHFETLTYAQEKNRCYPKTKFLRWTAETPTKTIADALVPIVP